VLLIVVVDVSVTVGKQKTYLSGAFILATAAACSEYPKWAVATAGVKVK